MTWEEAAKKYPTIVGISDEGVLELYADHHMLSSLRTCEGLFTESIINNLTPKGGRSWYLDMGVWFHSALEIFYEELKNGKNISLPEWVERSMLLWVSMNMNLFVNASGYKTLGGATGAVGLLTDYWKMYGDGKENLKIIGTELAFGRGKEVPIGQLWMPLDGREIECYYTGRMDDIVDDGFFIQPFDTKTKSRFDGNEATAYKPHEGMCGYVYSLQHMLRRYFPDNHKPCNRVLINHVQISPPKDGLHVLRFKRHPVVFSPAELEAWRVRQLSSFQKLYELLILERTPDWQTGYCNNLFGSSCPYKTLHSYDNINRAGIISANYETKPAWNPYKPPELNNSSAENAKSTENKTLEEELKAHDRGSTGGN